MISNNTEPIEIKPDKRATVPTSGLIKWVEPSGNEVDEPGVFVPQVRNRAEYFDDLQRAVAGLNALIQSEMSAAEILRKANMEIKKIEAETYDVVREFLGDDVTEQMQQISTDLDDLASLVSGIEASLAGFQPLIEEEKDSDTQQSAA